MAVNLTKNRTELKAAWNDVLDDKTATDWALFGYEGLSNDLKVVSKGSDGIEEMIQDLNSGQIMYAFLKIMDPKTSLPKNVLINWQGEGAPNVRKGTCANHIRDVSNFFKGAHVTINARTEEEVDPQLIIDKVSKSTGSAYNFKERIEHDSETGPVGTSYKRVIPKQEINSMERDKFWEKEEQEEKQRQQEERLRKEEERRKLEDERLRIEQEEAANREEKAKQRNQSINQIREAERINEVQESLNRQKLLEDSEREEKERRERAEILRRQRSQEAQQLIAKRTIDARAIFEQNTCAIQMNSRRASYQANGTPNKQDNLNASPDISPNDNQPMISSMRKCSLPILSGSTNKSTSESNAVPVSVNTMANGSQESNTVKNNGNPETVVEEQEWEDDVKQEIPAADVLAKEVTKVTEPEESQNKLEANSRYLNGEYGLTAVALYDYQADDDTEISFDPGDIITHIDQIDEGWWQGVGPHGVFGLFPANYVELLK
ncbi:hypothetical protein RUM44_001917 [Polyplax serrata]|uniref:Drebrin-like protein n=1 Tax=Polyplax serrata TaxID=468196 RepID=A0ABR1ALE4_POLSC